MKRIATLYGGSLPEHRVHSMEKYRHWLSDRVYIRSLAEADLDPFDVLLIPEGMHHRLVSGARDRLLAFLDTGKTIALFGDQPVPWLPGLCWEFREAQRPGPGDIEAGHADDPFHQFVPTDAIWHHHGVFDAPAGARTLLYARDGRSVVYVDTASTGGAIVASATDLFVHLGNAGNPVSERFLDGFLPWIAEVDLSP